MWLDSHTRNLFLIQKCSVYLHSNDRIVIIVLVISLPLSLSSYSVFSSALSNAPFKPCDCWVLPSLSRLPSWCLDHTVSLHIQLSHFSFSFEVLPRLPWSSNNQALFLALNYAICGAASIVKTAWISDGRGGEGNVWSRPERRIPSWAAGWLQPCGLWAHTGWLWGSSLPERSILLRWANVVPWWASHKTSNSPNTSFILWKHHSFMATMLLCSIAGAKMFGKLKVAESYTFQ